MKRGAINFSSVLRAEAQIAGVGVVGAFGSTAEELASAVAAGAPAEPHSACEQINHPDESAKSSLALRADVSGLERFIPKRALRRVDHFSRLALYAAHLALEDAGVDCSAPLGERVALVIATGYGAVGSTFSYLDSMIESGDDQSSPTHFSNSVHNAAAAHVSMRLGITGPNLTVSQGSVSVTSALAGALGYLADNEADAVLFGALDEASPVYGVGSSERQGEGATFFWLVRDRESSRYGELALFRSDEGAEAKASAEFKLLFGEGEVAGVATKDTTPVHGAFPTRAGLDLASCAQSAGKLNKGEEKILGVIERQGQTYAVAGVYPK